MQARRMGCCCVHTVPVQATSKGYVRGSKVAQRSRAAPTKSGRKPASPARPPLTRPYHFIGTRHRGVFCRRHRRTAPLPACHHPPHMPRPRSRLPPTRTRLCRAPRPRARLRPRAALAPTPARPRSPRARVPPARRAPRPRAAADGGSGSAGRQGSAARGHRAVGTGGIRGRGVCHHEGSGTLRSRRAILQRLGSFVAALSEVEIPKEISCPAARQAQVRWTGNPVIPNMGRCASCWTPAAPPASGRGARPRANTSRTARRPTP